MLFLVTALTISSPPLFDLVIGLTAAFLEFLRVGDAASWFSAVEDGIFDNRRLGDVGFFSASAPHGRSPWLGLSVGIDGRLSLLAANRLGWLARRWIGVMRWLVD